MSDDISYNIEINPERRLIPFFQKVSETVDDDTLQNPTLTIKDILTAYPPLIAAHILMKLHDTQPSGTARFDIVKVDNIAWEYTSSGFGQALKFMYIMNNAPGTPCL